MLRFVGCPKQPPWVYNVCLYLSVLSSQFLGFRFHEIESFCICSCFPIFLGSHLQSKIGLISYPFCVGRWRHKLISPSWHLSTWKSSPPCSSSAEYTLPHLFSCFFSYCFYFFFNSKLVFSCAWVSNCAVIYKAIRSNLYTNFVSEDDEIDFASLWQYLRGNILFRGVDLWRGTLMCSELDHCESLSIFLSLWFVISADKRVETSTWKSRRLIRAKQ